MQFLIIGFDGVDAEALERRLKARDAHVKKLGAMKKKKQALFAAALLSNEGQMSGSAIIVDFDDKDALEEWLRNEPYITADVWKNIKVFPCAVSPIFL
jgi:uncharacterized protein YciI